MGLFDKKSNLEKQREKIALKEIDSFKEDAYYKFRAIGPRYGIENMGVSEARFFGKVYKTIKKEIINDGLTVDGIMPRVHELFTEKYGKPKGHVEFNIDKSILKKSTQEQKEYLLKTGEYIIYIETTHLRKNKNPGTHTRPKGITDVIGGAFGNTAISMETTYTPKYSTGLIEWREYMLYLKDDRLTIPGLDKSVLYEHIAAVVVDRLHYSDKGYLMSIGLKRPPYNPLNGSIRFRTPIALGLEALLKEKMPKKNTAKSSSSNMDELKMCVELYEKGLLTEEEFNRKKKELLGL